MFIYAKIVFGSLALYQVSGLHKKSLKTPTVLWSLVLFTYRKLTMSENVSMHNMSGRRH
jgi:hypothetical protein